MTPTVIHRAVDIAVREHAIRSPGQGLGIVFFGGEPLLRRDLIVETLRYCRSIEQAAGIRFHYKVTTNGLLLDEDFLCDPETSGIFVALSHDGVAEAQDAHRVDGAGHGSFGRLEPTVDMLLRQRPHAPALMVVTPSTVHCYADSVRFLFERGFRYIISTLDFGADWPADAIPVLQRQYCLLAKWYERATRSEHKFFFSPFEVKIASHIRPEAGWRERCDLGQSELSVAPNGRFFPCVQFVGDGTDDAWCIGDVVDGLDEGARRRIACARWVEQETCRVCAVRARCNHHCACANLRATGRVDRVSPMVCAHERVVLPIADRLAERLFAKRSALFIQKHYNDFYPLVSAVEDALISAVPRPSGQGGAS